MNRIIVLIFVGFLISSCGARRQSNPRESKSKPVVVTPLESDKEIKTPVISTPSVSYTHLTLPTSDLV